MENNEAMREATTLPSVESNLGCNVSFEKDKVADSLCYHKVKPHVKEDG